MTEPRSVRLVGAANTAQIRVMKFEGRDHVVVPIVALIGDSVIHSSTAKFPELVPSHELSISVPGWNGEPVVGNHPTDDMGASVGANAPQILEKQSFGRVFNADFKNNKLTFEAWLDPQKAELVGRDAVRVIERALEGEPIEVSVGCFVTTEERQGSLKGKKFFGVWHDIVPDHLAMLPEGLIGACSNEMGCGVRQATRYLVTAEGLVPHDERELMPMFDSKALREKLRAMFGGGELLEFMKFREAGSAPSDHEIGAALESELFQSEKAFLGIDTINSQEGWVVFAAAPKGKVQLFQRNFEVADGLVTLGKDRLPVVSKYVFEAASESETVPEQEKKEACKCETETKSAESAEEIVMDVKLEERVKALIANEKSGLKETDFEWLSKAGEQAIVLLEKACAEPAPVAAAEPVVETKPEKVTVEVDAAELAELRAMAIEAKQKKQQQKNELVARLKEAQSVYSEAELIEKSIEDLVKLSQVAKVRVETEATDFSGAVPEKRVASSGDGVPQPIDLGARIRERYAKQQNG